MHNLTGKLCPLLNQQCLLNGCTLFNEIVDACGISVLSYNLYQLKEQIRAQRNENSGAPADNLPGISVPVSNSPAYPRPTR